MQKLGWRFRLGVFLVILSIAFYVFQYLIFHKLDTELFYIGIDISFLPIEVLVVVLVIERAINEKEKKIMLEKLNMVIGAFFSDVGTELIKNIGFFDPNQKEIRNYLIVNNEWDEDRFLKISEQIKNLEFEIQLDSSHSDSLKYLNDMKTFLVKKREFLLRLLENPNLLEHDSFTDMLWAVFHLTEELEKREDLYNLSKVDYEHLAGDINRAYGLLIYEWLQYMEHLMNNYPYLFSLALRTNPFDPDARVEFTE
ncbi:MAG: hypothetical protein KO217_05530 [Methanobacteriaceae archaeon]|jgi:hypothetical protein|nr:MAG: hypothetical protein CIT01_09960 [Methanobacterium sp. BRmetb2]MCC7558130.1 hypothetical protein [Methanobacteriaceae archaeon]